MDIQKLKNQTDILKIADTLGIKIGKNDKAICPFHPEKTPSLQFRATHVNKLYPKNQNYLTKFLCDKK